MKWSTEHGMVVRRWGSGPELVWVHGLGESSVSFEAIAQRLDGFAHVLVDLPGYGRSAWPHVAEGLAATADRLAAWIGAAAQPVVIGHSMGGVLAQLVAERGAARAIVDIDGNLTKGDCTFSLTAIAPDGGLAVTRDGVYARSAAEPPLRGYFAALSFASPAVFERDACDLVAMSERGDLAARLAKLPVPALYIAGDLPGGICAESRRQLDAVGARWLAIPGTGHWVYLDAPDRFADEVARFIRAS